MPTESHGDGDGSVVPKATIRNVDMPEEMQSQALALVRTLLAASAGGSQRDIAGSVKHEMDRLHGPPWHCIVGKNFGSWVTHEAGRFIFFYVDEVAVLLFKTG